MEVTAAEESGRLGDAMLVGFFINFLSLALKEATFVCGLGILATLMGTKMLRFFSQYWMECLLVIRELTREAEDAELMLDLDAWSSVLGDEDDVDANELGELETLLWFIDAFKAYPIEPFSKLIEV
ncbi:hypothetical protein WICPIJ_000236 [Wickerhamomyces pijperi]|uniref:Uncharacterized protein n=1 Tax=Wickerhamomyces pijperi TaxID=599730 RepID=A0A9P8QE43_WICPI|nr:hypothetical protein WICPIJ_000236 [Wickerhamomyces pijperi]